MEECAEALDILKRTPEFSLDQPFVVDEIQTSPLMIAASNKELDLLKQMLKSGVELDWHNENGETALHLAATEDFGDVASVLLKAGANPNMRDNEGSTSPPSRVVEWETPACGELASVEC